MCPSHRKIKYPRPQPLCRRSHFRARPPTDPPPRDPNVLAYAERRGASRSAPSQVAGFRRRKPTFAMGRRARAVLKVGRFDPAIPRARDWDPSCVWPGAARSRMSARRSTSVAPGMTGLRRPRCARPPAKLCPAALAVDKHRDRLGEDGFRRRLARVILSFLSKRRFEIRFVAAALWHAGPQATRHEIARKLRTWRLTPSGCGWRVPAPAIRGGRQGRADPRDTSRSNR